MLVHALTQLETAMKAKPFPDYVTAARLVEATWVLVGHFEVYIRTVEKMKLLKEVLDKRREELFRGIVFGFRVVGFNFQTALEKESNDKAITTSYSSIPMPAPTLVDSCLVITALGHSRQREFVTHFCEDHLEPYEQLFNPKMTTLPTSVPSSSTDASSKPSLKKKVGESSMGETLANPNPASLDQIERRFDWYRRMLRELEHKFPSVFPGTWNVHYHMTYAFLSKTKEHYSLLFINKEGPELFLRDRDCENVSILLKAFQKTVLFEKEMTAWLQRDYKTEFMEGTTQAPSSKESKLPSKDNKKSTKAIKEEDEEPVEFDETGKMVSANSVEGMRIKYDRKKKESTKFSNTGAESIHIGPVPRLLGVASAIFDSNMQPYIALERKSMEELLTKATSDGAVDTRGERPVFTSSTDLFVYIKNSVTRCTALTKGKTFFSLYKAYKDTLKKYAQLIAGKLPASNIPAGEERTVCHVVDTCEYCADTVEALQDLIQDKIDPEYKEKIDMNAEQEAFHDSSTKAIKLLVSGLILRVDSAFKEMSSINWGSMNVVGEESKYVRSIHDTIQPFVASVSELLPSSYFRNFCDKLASSFITSLYSNISKLKRISESGTQQLLLDVYNLKTLVLKIPTNDINKRSTSSKVSQASAISSSATSATTLNAPAAYVKMVTTQFQKIEILLKLVGTPLDGVIDVFKAQFVPIGGTVTDLQTVLNLKGMKKPDQTPILDKFSAYLSPIVKVDAASHH